MGWFPKPTEIQESGKELEKTVHKLIYEIGKALKFDVILGWLDDRLKKVIR